MMQRFLGLFIGLLVLVDAFFIAYAVGINVRKTNIVDPSLPIKAKVIPPAPKPLKSDEPGPVTDSSSTVDNKESNATTSDASN